MDFKLGDKVKIKRNCSNCIAGQIYTLHYNFGDGTSSSGGLVARDEVITKGCSCENNWEKVSGGKKKPMKFILTYDEDKDPMELFAEKSEAVKRIKELSENKNIRNMRLFEIKKEYEIEISKKGRLKKYNYVEKSRRR